MGDLEGIAESADKKRRPEPNMSGVFKCQVCGVRVKEAFYDHEEHVLVWICEDEHFSKIEEIKF